MDEGDTGEKLDAASCHVKCKFSFGCKFQNRASTKYIYSNVRGKCWGERKRYEAFIRNFFILSYFLVQLLHPTYSCKRKFCIFIKTRDIIPRFLANVSRKRFFCLHSDDIITTFFLCSLVADASRLSFFTLFFVSRFLNFQAQLRSKAR